MAENENEKSQAQQIEDIDTSLENTSTLKDNFQTRLYSLESTNKTYQKVLLTDLEMDYIADYINDYWNNHDPAAQGLCLFNS